MDKGKPQEKDPKGKSSEEDVEDIYFNKVCPEENCYLKTKICNLLYPNESMDSNTECEEIKCGNIYICRFTIPLFSKLSRESGRVRLNITSTWLHIISLPTMNKSFVI